MSDRQYIREMRRRLGIEADDISHDERIEQMTPHQRLRLLCGWYLGDPNWAETMLNWAKASGLKISE